MFKEQAYRKWVSQRLLQVSSSEKAKRIERYFPDGIVVAGAMAADMRAIIDAFHVEHAELSPAEVLRVSETLLKHAHYSEETIIAFGLLNRLVKRHFDDDLLSRFRYWLEHYVQHWGHVDDLCIKTIYQFFLSRTHLIETIQPWSLSEVPWCRRASNVAWVKFIRRPIGSKVFYLNPSRVFENCDQLMADSAPFVQKSVGWLLKVTSVHHQSIVLDYLQDNIKRIDRGTLRYALEKVDDDSRLQMLTLN